MRHFSQVFRRLQVAEYPAFDPVVLCPASFAAHLTAILDLQKIMSERSWFAPNIDRNILDLEPLKNDG
jgi:hypothetical protein